MSDYNKYYQTADLFGKPYKELIEFFAEYEPKSILLDVGCGQGRDSIPLAKMGYRVTGIDNSQVGIDQMLQRAKEEKLNVSGLVTDIYSFKEYSKYPIILLDSMIHFEKRDKEKEYAYLKQIWSDMQENSLLSIFMRVNKKNESILRKLVTTDMIGAEIIKDTYLEYIYEEGEHKSISKYIMLCVKKSA